MIYYYFGKNDFALNEKVTAIRKAWEKKHGKIAALILSGAELNAKQLETELTQLDLFATTKLIVLKNPTTNKTVWEKLGEILQQIPETTALIVDESAPDKRTKTHKDLIKNATKNEEFLELKPWQIENWTKMEMQKNNIEIKNGLNEFLQYCDFNQWRLKQEIIKLAKITKVLTLEIVQKYIEPDLSANAFEIFELAVNNKNKMQQELNKMQIKGDAYALFGLISSQLFTLKVIAENGGGKDFAIHPFVYQKNQELYKKLGKEKLNKIICDAVKTDTKLKSTGQDPWILLRIFLEKI